MVFCGDIALPYTSIDIDMPFELRRKNWFVNMEGSLIEASQVDEMLVQNRVFNNQDAIKELSEIFNLKVCSLANNHIEDCSKIDDTIKILKNLGIKNVGAGVGISEAEKSVVISQENLMVLSFGWDVIKCPMAGENISGVNPYKREHVIESVKMNLKQAEKLLCFFHWGYELEAYPLPYDRELAHTLIDMGVSAVVGCHAHRVQQIEFYKGRPIVYGLGNFLFPHSVYWDGRLKFPEFTKTELVFELTKDSRFIAHWFEYDIAGKKLLYVESEEIDEDSMNFKGRAEYSGFSAKEYDKFFKRNRYHKKLIPIFKSQESHISYIAKSSFVKYRGKLIDMLVKMNLKAKK